MRALPFSGPAIEAEILSGAYAVYRRGSGRDPPGRQPSAGKIGAESAVGEGGPEDFLPRGPLPAKLVAEFSRNRAPGVRPSTCPLVAPPKDKLFGRTAFEIPWNPS